MMSMASSAQSCAGEGKPAAAALTTRNPRGRATPVSGSGSMIGSSRIVQPTREQTKNIDDGRCRWQVTAEDRLSD